MFKFHLRRADGIAAEISAYDDMLADTVVLRFGCGLSIHLKESEARAFSAALALAADETAKATALSSRLLAGLGLVPPIAPVTSAPAIRHELPSVAADNIAGERTVDGKRQYYWRKPYCVRADWHDEPRPADIDL